MKLTKSQLKQIIKEELEIFEAEMVVRGGRHPLPKSTAPWSQRRQTAARFDVHDKIQGQGPGGEMTRFDYERKHVPASEEELAEMDPVQALLNRVDTAMALATDDPIRQLMLETVIRMIEVYSEGEELPPVIEKMAELTIDRKYSDIRANFNKMWMELILYHRGKGTQLHTKMSPIRSSKERPPSFSQT